MDKNPFWLARFVCAGLSQSQAASLCGVSVRQVKRWEKGQARVPLSALRLVQLLGAGDLGQLSKAWAGWFLKRGQLVSPESVCFNPGEVRALPLLYASLAARILAPGRRSVKADQYQPVTASGAAGFSGFSETGPSCPAAGSCVSCVSSVNTPSDDA